MIFLAQKPLVDELIVNYFSSVRKDSQSHKNHQKRLY